MSDMHEFVAEHDEQSMRELVTRNPGSVNQLDEQGFPPLYTAALYRNQQAIDFLLDYGAEVDIFASAYLGRLPDAKRLLEHNPQLARATTPNGMTALHYAARAGHFEIVDALLRYDSDVDARDHNGRTALLEAAHGGPWKANPAEEIIQLLLDHNAQIDLFTAASIGRVDLIQALIDRDGTQIDDLNHDGETALYTAAHNNQFAAVKMLVERGADVNRSDAVGIAALHRTSQQCSDKLIRYLIDQGAAAHLCCHVACGDEIGTRHKLALHPDAASEIFYEFNAVGYAIHCWQLGTLRILLEHGCTLSEDDQQHILRISDNDQQLLDELLSIQ